MKNKLFEFIDFEKVNELLEGFNKTTGFVTAILDLEGNVLSKSGWRQICTEFHRVHNETSNLCTISDTELAGKLAEGEKYHFYKCLNGLVDVAVPIIINGEHIANLFSGQFFFEEPDKEFFIKQAKKYRFNIDTYLAALEKVPVVSQEKVKTAMDFLLNMTQLISETTFQKIEQSELINIIRESEEKYRMLHETAGVGIGYYTPKGIVISYNSIAAQNMNGKPEDFAGKSVYELFPKPEAEFYLERIKKAAISETPQVYEDKIDLPIGVAWFNSVYTRILDSNYNIAGIQIISTDISDRKLAEEEQQNLLDRFNRISSNVPGAIFEFCLNPDGTSYIPYASEGIINIFGLKPEEVKTDSTPLFQMVHPDDKESFYAIISESAEKLTPWHDENRFILPSGEIIWVEGKSTPQKLEDGRIIWQGYLNDVTERKNAEKKLHESEEKYRQLYESNQMPISIFDTETLKFLSVNNAFAEKYGYTKEEFLNMTILDIRPESETEKLKGSVKITDEGIVNAGVFLHKKKNGEIIHVEIIRYDLVFEGKKAKLVFANDITDRIKAEAELKLSEEKFEESFRLSPYLVSITAMDGKVLEVNDRIFETFGYTREEFLGNNTTVLPIWVHPEERAASINELKQAGILREMEVKYRKKTGEIGDFLLSAVIIELNNEKVLLSIIHDITERKQKERELQISEEKFRATAEFSPLAIYASSGTDQKGEYVNPAFLEIFGFTLEDVPTVGVWWTKAFPDEKYRQWVMETWQKNIDDANLNNTNIAALECVCNCKDGSQKIISWEGANIGDSFWAFGLDLTERVKAEKALQKSNSLLKSIIDSPNNIIMLASDLDFNYLSFNQAHIDAVKFTYGSEPEIGKNILSFIPVEEDRLKAKANYKRVLKGERFVEIQEFGTKDTRSTWELIFNPIINTSDQITGFTVFVYDITEKKQAEEKIRNSQNALNQAQAIAKVGSWEMDIETKKRVWSKQMYNILEIDPEEEPSDELYYSRVHPDDLVMAQEKDKDTINNEKATRNNYRLVTPTGGIKHVLVEGYQFYDENNNAKKVTGIIQDITESKKAIIELNESEEKFKSSFHTNPAAQAILSLDGKFIESNEAFSKLIGFTKKEIIGKSSVDLDLLSLEERDKLAAHAKASGGTLRNAEVKFKIKDGSFRNVLYSIEQILLNGIPHRLSMGIDITERKQAEEEIRKLNAELENRVINRTTELANSQTALINLVEDLNEKTELLEKSTHLLESKNKELETFTYSVSHDLKAPLRGIDGYSRLLEESHFNKLDKEGQKFVKTIRKGTKQMNQLIEDLLAYSRLERSSLRPSAINLKQFIEDILLFFKDDILKNKVTVEKNIQESQIFADSDGLTIALRNIVENAIKFSSKVPSPRIRISLLENENTWLLSVEDNGIGFDMKFQKRIFEIFQRLNLPEDYEGTGIGLAMVNKSIERMGGKIWAESEFGKGAKFYIEIAK